MWTPEQSMDRRNRKVYPETHESGSPTFMRCSKSVLREKLILMNAHIRNKDLKPYFTPPKNCSRNKKLNQKLLERKKNKDE